MDAFQEVLAPLQVLLACTQQAIRYNPRFEVYAGQLRTAERALGRATLLGERLLVGLPKHRKLHRTIREALDRAAVCLGAIKDHSPPDVLVRRANAMQRVTGRFAELTALPPGQVAQGGDEVLVGESPWTALLDVPDALGPGEPGRPVQHDAGDEAAAVAPLSAGDEHTGSTE